MKKSFLWIILFFMSLNVMAQEVETRSFSFFTQVEIAGGYDVEFIKSDKDRIKIISKNLPLEDIITTQSGATLHIGRKKKVKTLLKHGHTKLIIEHSSLITNMTISGSGFVVVKDPIKVDEFVLHQFGSSKIVATVNAKRVKIKVTGSSNTTLKGTCDKLYVNAVGSSDCDLSKLKSRRAEVSSFGSADLKIYVSAILIAKATGSGIVSYVGAPNSVTAKKFGSGKIKKYGASSTEEEEDDDDF